MKGPHLQRGRSGTPRVRKLAEEVRANKRATIARRASFFSVGISLVGKPLSMQPIRHEQEASRGKPEMAMTRTCIAPLGSARCATRIFSQAATRSRRAVHRDTLAAPLPRNRSASKSRRHRRSRRKRRDEPHRLANRMPRARPALNIFGPTMMLPSRSHRHRQKIERRFTRSKVLRIDRPRLFGCQS